jgi:hypothetical protein
VVECISNLLVLFPELLHKFRIKQILLTGYGFGIMFAEHLDFAASVLPVGLL